MKIKHKFSVLLGLFCVLLLLLLWYLSNRGKEVFEKQYLDQFERESILLIDMIERNLFERYHDARIFSLFLANPTAEQYQALSDDQQVTDILNAYVVNFKMYRWLFLLDTQGNLLAANSVNSKGAKIQRPTLAADKIRQMPWFQQTLAGEFLSDDSTIGTVVQGPDNGLLALTQNEQNRYEMVFASQVLSPEGKVVGVWASIVDFGEVEMIVSRFYKLLANKGYFSAELTILDRQGNVIVDWDPVGQLKANYERDFNVLGKLNLAKNGVTSARMAVAGQRGANISVHYRKQIEQLSGFAHSHGAYDYPGLGWSALVRVPLDEVFDPIDDLQYKVIAQALSLAFGAFLAGLWLSRRISLPLQQSTTALRQMSKGDLDAQVPDYQGTDEVGDINRALVYFKRSLIEKAKLQQETEEQKRQLNIRNRAIDATATGIVVCDMALPDNPLIYVNKAFERLTGYTAEEAIGRNCRFLQGTDTDPNELARLREAISKGQSCSVVLVNYRKNGDAFFNNLRVDPLFDDQGQLTHFIGVQSDITEFKQNQELAQFKLEKTIEQRTRTSREAENRLRTIFNTSMDTMVVFDQQGLILELNHSGEITLGRIKEELVSSRFDALIADSYQQSFDLLISSIAKQHETTDPGRRLEIELRQKNGRLFPVELALGMAWVGSEQIFVAIIRDITEQRAARGVQKRLKDELIEREQIYRAAFDQAAVGIARVSTDGNWLEVNEKLCEIVGYSREELLQIDFQTITHSDDLDKDLQLVEKVLSNEIQTYRIDKRYFRKDGQIVWINLSVSLVRDKMNKPKYFISIVEDISDRKHFETQLQHAQKRQQELLTGQTLASVAGGICYWSWDLTNNKLVWDEATYQIYGLSSDTEVTLDVWKRFIHPKDLQITEKGLQEAIEGCFVWSAEYRILHGTTGQTRWLKVAADVQPDESGKAVKLFGVKLDVSDERVVQLALEKESKAAQQASDAKSRFLATMSHEIRTPINSVIGMIDLLRDTSMSNDQHKMARTIRDAAFSLLDIINDILDFSKIEAGQMALELVSTDVNDVLERCAEALWIHAEKLNVKLYIVPDLSIPGQLRLDVVRLRQVILNLLGNAIKFSHGLQRQGEIIISSKLLSQQDNKIKLALSVCDNGIGMTKAQLAKLFQPFHQADTSTTRRYGGTGLGLSITKALVEMMNGEINIDSRFGFGSTFTVTLDAEPVSSALSDLTEIDLSGLTMLICIDDDKLAGIIGDIISQFNCPQRCLLKTDIDKHLGSETINDCDVVIIDDLSALKKIQNHYSHNHGQYKGYLLLCNDPAIEKGLIDHSHFTIGHHPFKPSELILGCAVAAGRESPVIERLMLESLYSDQSDNVIIDNDKQNDLLILVAEDQPTNREVIKRQLDKLGYNCDIADDGLEALERWHSGRYDLLLTDCHMPNLDGFELTAKIRQIENDDPTLKKTPIIAVTANALAGEAEHCLQAGMDDYLAKPVELPKLAKLLKHWQSKLSQPSSDSNITTQKSDDIILPTQSTPEPVNFNRLASILGTDDKDILHGVLNSFWQSLLNDMPQIEYAIDNKQSTQLKERTHAAKGAARSSGVETLADLLQAMENKAQIKDWQAVESINQQLREELQRLHCYLTEQSIIGSIQGKTAYE